MNSLSVLYSDPIIIAHTCTDLTAIPQSLLETAKADLIIAYDHISHDNQGTTAQISSCGCLPMGPFFTRHTQPPITNSHTGKWISHGIQSW